MEQPPPAFLIESTSPAPVDDLPPARVRACTYIYNKRQPARMKGENEEKNKKTPPAQHPQRGKNKKNARNDKKKLQIVCSVMKNHYLCIR